MNGENLKSARSPWTARGSDNPPILLIGLGNPILGDDGVGWRVADDVQKALDDSIESPSPIQTKVGVRGLVEIDSLSLGGLSLMERMVGYRKVILVDAISSGDHPIGNVRLYPLDEIPDQAQGHTTSVHDTSLKTAIQLGRSMGIQLPDEIVVVAIEAEISYEFSEGLSPAVSAAVSTATQIALKQIEYWAR